MRLLERPGLHVLMFSLCYAAQEACAASSQVQVIYYGEPSSQLWKSSFHAGASAALPCSAARINCQHLGAAECLQPCLACTAASLQ